MNFVEITAGIFIGVHMITRFEIAMIAKDENKQVLYLWFIGDGEAPGLEVVVDSKEEALAKLGMKAISNLNLVKP